MVLYFHANFGNMRIILWLNGSSVDNLDMFLLF